MIKVEFAELHGPLFLAGKNHGLKLFAKAGIQLEYDYEKNELLVHFNQKTAHIPSSNIVSYTPGEPIKEEKPTAPKLGRPPKAQASTPYDHVFAEAPGKVRN